MDLTDLDSVRAAAARINDSDSKLDLLMAVAGVMATPERRVGPGWESQLASNHFGHFPLAWSSTRSWPPPTARASSSTVPPGTP